MQRYIVFDSSKFGKMELGIKFANAETLEEFMTTAMGFVDDNDLVEDGKNMNEIMQIMLMVHNNMCKATGSHVEEDKAKHCV